MTDDGQGTRRRRASRRGGGHGATLDNEAPGWEVTTLPRGAEHWPIEEGDDEEGAGPGDGAGPGGGAGDDRPPTHLSDAELARLDALVLVARAGDRVARDAAYWLLRPAINGWVSREWWRARRLDIGIEPDDLHSEAFLAFEDLTHEWSGEGPFGLYAHRVLPMRVRGRARALAGLPARQLDGDPLRWTVPLDGATLAAVVDGPGGLAAEDSWLAEQAISLLETLADGLDPIDRLVLLWRVRDGRTMSWIGDRLGVTRRHAHRVWLDLTERIRSDGFAWPTSGAAPTGGPARDHGRSHPTGGAAAGNGSEYDDPPGPPGHPGPTPPRRPAPGHRGAGRGRPDREDAAR